MQDCQLLVSRTTAEVCLLLAVNCWMVTNLGTLQRCPAHYPVAKLDVAVRAEGTRRTHGCHDRPVLDFNAMRHHPSKDVYSLRYPHCGVNGVTIFTPLMVEDLLLGIDSASLVEALSASTARGVVEKDRDPRLSRSVPALCR